ncbi:MAG: hypothetical protein LBS40_02850 [Burkholderiales bacterium]|jgi:SH3-like domain-containing protein|nr:hypothetical protein [Burkholderiales bacterium]
MVKHIARVMACLAALGCAVAYAADFRAVEKAPTVMYDAPSQKARALFIYGAQTPLELISSIEGWCKVRDAQGSIGWLEQEALGDRNYLQVRVARADVRAQPSDSADLVFEAEQNVLLKLDEAATSPTNTLTPGWVRIRHDGGQNGYVRIDRIFGL